RIELGEIEAALRQHQDIKECVVTVREEQPNDKRLVAYFVPRSGQLPAAGKLREFLKSKLPEYMVPSGFVPLEALPLTPNGKIARKALPKPSEAGPARNFRPQRSSIDQKVSAIYCELLGLKQTA